MKRRFNRREKNAIYIAYNGKCQLCGCLLDETWEADHIKPYSKGGETRLSNAQALCRKCNRMKGNRMLELRPFQREFISKTMLAAQNNKRVLVGNIHPGSGKTLAALLAANELMKAGYIDSVVIVVPRKNLASQFEEDWNDRFRPLIDNPAMGGIHWRENVMPLIKGGDSGYITTYQSLIADKDDIHREELSGRRFLLICDEASQLGVALNENDDATKSAAIVESLGQMAKMIFVLSGTMTRADGQPLLFAYPDFYEESFRDGSRVLRLKADVETDYLTGVREGYLRPFEFVLHDGYADWINIGADAERLTLSELENALYKVISQPQYWQDLIDRFADKLREQKNFVSPDLCGLIAAYNQPQAKEIHRYLKQKHSDLVGIVAVSEDGTEAHKNLELFRGGGFDVLITVNMAYIGFDHKPINVVCPLTSYRTEGYLRQLFARGLRMMPNLDPELQTCYGIVPDDIRMSQFVHMLRRESDHALVIKEDEQQRIAGGERLLQPNLGYALDANLTQVRAQGIDPTGDMSSSEYEHIEAIKIKHQSPEPAHRLKAMLADLMGVVNTGVVRDTSQATQGRYITEKEKEYKARGDLQKLVASVAFRFFDSDYRAVNTMLLKQGFKPNEQCTVEELHAKIVWLEQWKRKNG